jgi:hypothetical protein
VPDNRRGKKAGTGERRYGGGVHGVPHQPVSYRDADLDIVLRAICSVTDAGDAITFGKTSEGGAYYVGILADGVLEKFYLEDCDALEASLSSIAEHGEALIQ